MVDGSEQALRRLIRRVVLDEVRRALEQLGPRTCAVCDAPLEGKRSHARYCSNPCRVRACRARRRDQLHRRQLARRTRDRR